MRWMCSYLICLSRNQLNFLSTRPTSLINCSLHWLSVSSTLVLRRSRKFLDQNIAVWNICPQKIYLILFISFKTFPPHSHEQTAKFSPLIKRSLSSKHGPVFFRLPVMFHLFIWGLGPLLSLAWEKSMISSEGVPVFGGFSSPLSTQ